MVRPNNGQKGPDLEEPGEKQPELFDIHVMFFAGEPDATVDALTASFRIDRESAIRLITEVPVVVKRAVGPEVAADVVDVLNVLGAQVVLLPAASAVPSEADALELSPSSLARAQGSSRDDAPARPAWGGLESGPQLAPRAAEEIYAPRARPAPVEPRASRMRPPIAEEVFAPRRAPAVEAPQVSRKTPVGGGQAARPATRAASQQVREEIDLRARTRPADAPVLVTELPFEPERETRSVGAPIAELETGGGWEADLDTVEDSWGKLQDGEAGALELDLSGEEEPAVLQRAEPTPARAAPAMRAASVPLGSVETDDGLVITPLFDAPVRAPSVVRAPMPPVVAIAAPLPRGSDVALDLGLGDVPPLPDLGLGDVPPLPSLDGPGGPPSPPPVPSHAAKLTPPIGAGRANATSRMQPPPPPPPTGQAAPESRQRAFYERTLAVDDELALPSFGAGPTVEARAPAARSGDAYWAGRRAAGEPEAPAPHAVVAPVVEERAEPKPLLTDADEGSARSEQQTTSESPPVARSVGLPLLEVAAGVAAFGLGFQQDSSILLGNASTLMTLVHGLGLYAMGAGALRADRPSLRHVLGLALAIGLAFGANHWLRPRVDYAEYFESHTLPTGKLALEGGRAELELLDLLIVATEAKSPVGRSLPVQELWLQTSAVATEEPDLRVIVSFADAELEGRDAAPLVGQELPVLAHATGAELASRIRVPGTESAAEVVAGTLKLSEVLQVDSGAWRVQGTLELDTRLGKDEGHVAGRVSGKLLWQ